MASDHWKIPWLGISIKKEVDSVALVALVLSLVAFGSQIKGYLVGEDVRLLPPDQVFFMRDDSGSDHKVRVRFGANMVYVNEGQAGFNGTVSLESIIFQVGGKSYSHNWNEFGKFEGDTENLRFSEGVAVAAFTVSAGETKSHQTQFVPWAKACEGRSAAACNQMENHVFWDDFIAELKSDVAKGQRFYPLEFKAEIYDNPPTAAGCKIEISDQIIGAIEDNKGYNPTCFPN